jgi:hypothetical protein
MTITIRFSSFCLLIVPGQHMSPYAAVPHSIPSLLNVLAIAILVAVLGACGGRVYFYDYEHAPRYIRAIVLSWAVVGLSIWLAFHRFIYATYYDENMAWLGLVCSIFGSFLLGLAIFCHIRHTIDERDPWNRPPEQFDEHTIAKVVDRASWPFFRMPHLLFTIVRGVDDGGNYVLGTNDSNYHYIASGVFSLTSAILVSHGRPEDATAYIMAMPTAAVLSMHWTSNELRHAGDVGNIMGWPIVCFFVGLLPGVAVFVAVRKWSRRLRQDQIAAAESSSGPPSSVVETTSYLGRDRSDYECLEPEHVDHEEPVAITDQVFAVEILPRSRAKSTTIIGEAEVQYDDEVDNSDDSVLPHATIVPTTNGSHCYQANQNAPERP